MNHDRPFDEWVLGESDGIAPQAAGAPLFHDRALTLHGDRGGTLYRLEYADIATFSIDFERMQVTARPGRGVSWPEVEDLYRDQVLPRLLGSQGRLVLHATSVAREGRAFAIVGSTGQGKSTLAAALGQRGWGVLGDDAALIDPSGPCLSSPLADIRLHADSRDAVGLDKADLRPVAYSGKHRLAGAGERPVALPLAAMLVLDDAGVARCTVRPLSQREACMALLAQRFALDPGNARVAGRHLELASLLVRSVAVAAIDYPRRYDHLDELCGFIERRFDELAAEPQPA